jgi:hypothetical protein
MPKPNDSLISAIVLLYSASGKKPSGLDVITAETLQTFRPDPRVVQDAQAQLNALGFQVSPLVGISFSIIAPPAVFERVFHITVQHHDHKGWQVTQPKRAAGYELPVESLPPPLRKLVAGVTFTPPPDFGPTDFMENEP